MDKLWLQLRIRYYTLIVWGRGVKSFFYYSPKAWIRGMRVKLRVVMMILRGESVCYRASFADKVSFSGDDPEMVECSFFQVDGNVWLYTHGEAAIKEAE